MDHSFGFLKIVNEAKIHVNEVSASQLREAMKKNPKLVLVDVREDQEWTAGHAMEAHHLGKGVLERDIESRFPNPNTEIVMYCGGGYRSILSCEAAQRMGYKNVFSLIGGYKCLVAENWHIKKG